MVVPWSWIFLQGWEPTKVPLCPLDEEIQYILPGFDLGYYCRTREGWDSFLEDMV